MSTPEYPATDVLVRVDNPNSRRGVLASFAAGAYATLGALTTAKTFELAIEGYPKPVLAACGALAGVLILNAGNANLVAVLETDQESYYE